MSESFLSTVTSTAEDLGATVRESDDTDSPRSDRSAANKTNGTKHRQSVTARCISVHYLITICDICETLDELNVACASIVSVSQRFSG